MELSKAIRFGYYNALNGNVKLEGIPVKFFDSYAIPEDEPKPYVVLSTQTSGQLDIKRCKRYNSSILIDIVTGGQNNLAGKIQSEDIAEQIENIINPNDFSDLDITSYGYQLANTTRASDTDTNLQNGHEYIYRKLITYEHLIIKL